MTDLVLVDVSDGVQTVRMNRPDKKNALTTAMYAVMADALDAANASKDIKCTVFLGVPGCFTGGNDIPDFIAAASGASGLSDTPVLRFLRGLALSEKPILAGVDGVAVGLGTTMMFHCDLVFATENALFKAPFLDLGLIPEAGSTLIGPALMGQQRSFELLCYGEPFSAEDGRLAGFVSRVVGSAELEDKVREAALRVAAKPPEALQMSRRLMRGDTDAILARIEQETASFGHRLKSAEAREAFTAFMEKRPADFSKLA